MKNTIENTFEILSETVSGFHQYILSDPIHLSFVSKNLCDMTGYCENELLSDTHDRYADLVHPADKEKYSAFIKALSLSEQKLTEHYRIIKKDGSVCYVNDTVTTKLSKDGLVGYSVLTDITELKNENDNLQFLNETIPCGFVKYTCDSTPKVTYVNEQMLNILGLGEVKDGELDYIEMYKQNIYFMIPMEERRRFALYLKRVYKLGVPIAGEMTVLRCDGSKAQLFGWVTKCVNEQGVEEFQSACIDITERYNLKKKRETKRYLKALTEVYDKIFEYDLANNTVKCLYGQNSPMFKWIENIPMQMEEATEKWIISTVCDDDRENVSAFFNDLYQKKLIKSSDRPPQITYRAMSSTGTLQTYSGILLKTDTSRILFCCKNTSDEQEADILRSENETLKNMQQFVMRFTEGVVAFEVKNDTVKPLYSSDNVCNFFGYTSDEWLDLMNKNQSIQDFISQSGIDYEDVQQLFATGEAEFTYFDMAKNTERRIKAICSQKNSDNGSPCYVMLYNMDAKSAETTSERPDVYIRTFGYFDVFVDDKPIAFRNEKSKELFALLIDRRGGFVSSEEAIGFLWEDETANSVTLARYRKVALRLKNILEEYGISDIIESVNGKRRIVADKVKCDLYDYLSGKEEHAQLFKGSYLTNYSWGEITLSELCGDNLF